MIEVTRADLEQEPPLDLVDYHYRACMKAAEEMARREEQKLFDPTIPPSPFLAELDEFLRQRRENFERSVYGMYSMSFSDFRRGWGR